MSKILSFAIGYTTINGVLLLDLIIFQLSRIAVFPAELWIPLTLSEILSVNAIAYGSSKSAPKETDKQ